MSDEKKTGVYANRTPCVLTDGVFQEFMCHWLELSVRKDADEIRKIIEKNVSEILKRKKTVLLQSRPGGRFYRRSLRGKGIWIAWEHVNSHDREKVYLQFKGEAFEVYGPEVIKNVIKEIWGEVEEAVRIDVAFDGVPFTPEQWYLAWKGGKTFGKRVDYLENNRGHAARVGVLRKDCSQVSLYDERGKVRLEFRTRNRDLAGKILRRWVNGGEGELGLAGIEAIRDFIGGSWAVLDEWLGDGKKLKGEKKVVVEKRISGRSAMLAARKIVEWGRNNGKEDGLALLLARAAKDIGAAELDELGIDYTDVAKIFGRVGPGGGNEKVKENAELFRKVGVYGNGH